MVMPVISKPTYPNVPNVSGAPTVARSIASIQNTVVTLATEVTSVFNMFSTPQWGLYTQDGSPAFSQNSGGIIQDVISSLSAGGISVGELEFRFDHRVASAPQEQGAFLSYNKTSTPFAGKVKYYVGGSSSNRSAFLAQVIDLQFSTTLLNLVMPEYSYQNCTITHHDFRRTSRNGISLLEVDVWVEEVRIVGEPAYSNTQQPSGASPANGGTVQPQTPTLGQTQAVTGTGGPT